MDQKAIVIAVPTEVARRIYAAVDEGSGYASVSEFARIAFENQLALDEGLGRAADHGTDDEANQQSGSRRPSAPPLSVPAETLAAETTNEPLFSLTNRLLPIKVSCRVLANEGPVAAETFRRLAAEEARSVGLRLRALDSAAGLRGRRRRWIALPVGEDESAALARFMGHFTATAGSAGSGISGPLAALGLVVVREGLLELSTRGWELARLWNPALDDPETTEDVLSPEERAILQDALRTNPRELGMISELVEVVRSNAGDQAAVDAALGRLHAWTPAQAVAHRAALLGRLGDLGLVEVDGRGPTARIRVSDAVSDIVGPLEGE